MFRLFKGCAVMLALIILGPMLVFAITPRSLWLIVFLGLATVAVLALRSTLRLVSNGGVLMFLLGRASARRR